jgi:hypothetical protein
MNRRTTSYLDSQKNTIMEGDIMASSDNGAIVGFIRYEDNEPGIQIEYDCHWFPCSEMATHNVRVVGNIVTHPHLLTDFPYVDTERGRLN